MLQLVNARVRPRGRVSVFGDRWIVSYPTGRRDVYDSPEALTEALVARGMLRTDRASGSERREIDQATSVEELLDLVLARS